MRSREQEEKRGKEEGRPTGCHFSKKAFFLSDSHNTTHKQYPRSRVVHHLPLGPYCGLELNLIDKN